MKMSMGALLLVVLQAACALQVLVAMRAPCLSLNVLLLSPKRQPRVENPSL
jgi:hypothetical protein